MRERAREGRERGERERETETEGDTGAKESETGRENPENRDERDHKGGQRKRDYHWRAMSHCVYPWTYAEGT